MKNRIIHSFSIMLCLVLANSALQAQQARTGTNLKSKSMPYTTLHLNEPDEVSRIRELMVQGKKGEALSAAENYIKKVERLLLPGETIQKYYAYNAYCTVLTSHGRIEEAVNSCSAAMEQEPLKWSAVNNRGTAKLVGGEVEEALSDYRTALSLVEDGNASAQDTILHNITLAEGRLH